MMIIVSFVCNNSWDAAIYFGVSSTPPPGTRPFVRFVYNLSQQGVRNGMRLVFGLWIYQRWNLLSSHIIMTTKKYPEWFDKVVVGRYMDLETCWLQGIS